MMIPIVLIIHDLGVISSVSATAWASVAGLALLSTAFAYILFFGLIASVGATNTSLVTLLVPPSAILLGAVFLSEQMEAFELAGMALIGVGLLAIDGRVFAMRRATSVNRS
jgi:drug/metabolite transporter (DMT)-like permease